MAWQILDFSPCSQFCVWLAAVCSTPFRPVESFYEDFSTVFLSRQRRRVVCVFSASKKKRVSRSATWHLFIRLLHTIKHQKRFISTLNARSSLHHRFLSLCLFNKIVIYHVFVDASLLRQQHRRRLLLGSSQWLKRIFIDEKKRENENKW